MSSPLSITLPSCNRTFVLVSDSCLLSYPLTNPQRCLFNLTMLIPKKPVHFCLSLFYPRPFFSRFPFHPTFFGSKIAFHNAGTNQLHTCYSMDKDQVTGIGDKISHFQPTTLTDGGQEPCIWSSPGGGHKIDMGKQIFCNRSLNMKNIVAVGFDMDYTLAQYKPETFETLAYNGTIRKLVYDLGYPEELLEWSFDWRYMVRGLVLDKKRGNILKMDRHKYVKVAYHGFREMSKEDKVDAYGNTLIRDAFDEPDYALIDTLFSLAEAFLFAQLVDFMDNNPGKVPKGAE